jgi:hypothetical protein
VRGVGGGEPGELRAEPVVPAVRAGRERLLVETVRDAPALGRLPHQPPEVATFLMAQRLGHRLPDIHAARVGLASDDLNQDPGGVRPAARRGRAKRTRRGFFTGTAQA